MAVDSWPDCRYWEPFHFADVAASSCDVVEFDAVVGPATVELGLGPGPGPGLGLGLGLVHDAVRRVVDCGLLRVLYQQEAISQANNHT